jgi:hypothetical protein
LSSIDAYIAKYHTRLSPQNLRCASQTHLCGLALVLPLAPLARAHRQITQLKRVVKSFSQYLTKATHADASAAAAHMFTVAEFPFEVKIDNVNLFELKR